MSDTVYTVPPVERALRLLRHIGAGDTVANVSRTAASLGINRTTLIRLLHTLEAERFIERRPEGAGWRLGLGAFTVAAEALAAQDVVQVGSEVLAGLVERLGLSAHLAVLDERDIVYLLRHTPNVPMVSNVRVGSRLPSYATNMGRAILAHMPKASVRALFVHAPMKPITPQTPTNIDALMEQLCHDRDDGLAWSESYFEPGINSVAAPIFDSTGICIAAINVTGRAEQFETNRVQIGAAVRQAAQIASGRLGFSSSNRSCPWSVSISSAA